MITSVNMIRKMGNFDVTQRTKDSFFNASELMNQWNSYSGQKKNINHFLDNSSTKEFIDALIDEMEIRDSEKPINQVFTKSRAITSKTGKRTPGSVWMHPYLFIDFAMWLNPRFKYKVIQFVYDQLMSLRDESGDRTKELNSAIRIFEPKTMEYMKLAKGINFIVFNKHHQGIRDTATEEQAKSLVELQKNLAFSIEMGYIKSFDELLNEMRRIWNYKYNY